MYRVAVIMNESEMLRNGYINIIPNLKKTFSEDNYINLGDNPSGKYEFISFTILNFEKLFQKKSESYLMSFDSLFISTNATSDNKLYEIITKPENAKVIEEFIEADKGIFISSQKKLSRDNSEAIKTSFLPMDYDYFIINRPKNELDSGEGTITVKKDMDGDYLFSNIGSSEELISKEIDNRCEKNPFKRHRYRSIIKPINEDVYETILVDGKNYNDSNFNYERKLLLRSKQKKIVLSSIVIDWEQHDKLLKNIVRFITEGLPEIAFIVDNTNDLDFKYMYSAALASKRSFKIFKSFDVINDESKKYINIYISYPKNEDDGAKVDLFWNGIKHGDKHVKLFLIENIDQNERILKEYSNFSSIDLLIDKTLLWLSNEYVKQSFKEGKNNMWGRSFWISYDVMKLLKDLEEYSIRYKGYAYSYIIPVFKSFVTHNPEARNGGFEHNYDGIIGCSCALLELLYIYKDELDTVSEFVSERIQNMYALSKWIEESIITREKSVGLSLEDVEIRIYETQTAIISAHKILKSLTPNTDLDHEFFNVLTRIVSNVDFVEDKLGKEHNLQNMTEIDICRNIELLIVRAEKSQAVGNSDYYTNKVSKYLDILNDMQNSNGLWLSISRSADTLSFLQSNKNRIEALYIINSNRCLRYIELMDSMIEKSMNALLFEYQKEGNWLGDLLTTAKTLNAVVQYNKVKKYSTKDFYETIIETSKERESYNFIKSTYLSLSKLRNEISRLQDEKESLQLFVSEKARDIDIFIEQEKGYKARIETSITVALFAVFGAIIYSLNAFTGVSSIIEIIISFFISNLIARGIFVLSNPLDIKAMENKRGWSKKNKKMLLKKYLINNGGTISGYSKK